MPYTDCKIVITQGKNTGQLCGDVCRRCHHAFNVCSVCSKQFNRDTAYLTHIKTCCQKVKPTIIKKGSALPSDFYDQMKDMLSKAVVEAVNAVMQTAPVQPTNIITNNITSNITYQHIAISDIGAYKTLCDKMGINEATDFLCKLATKPQIMPLFEKLYLECDPSSYPIVNNNGKDFYYRDGDDNIVHDSGGHKIAKLGERLMKNTFIEAADPLLKRFVRQNDGDHEGDDNDYDRFRELQNGASNFKADRSFIADLYPKTYNPNHTFFKEINKL